MTVWYPSAVVHITLRFDESLRVVPDPELLTMFGNVPFVTTNALLGDRRDGIGASQTGDPTGARGVDPLTSDLAPRLSEPLVIPGSKNLSHVLNRVPRSATFELPGVRVANRFTMTFSWRELPIDPRTVRAAGVEIHLGTVSPDDFASGMVTVERDGSRRSVLRTRAGGEVRRESLLFYGLVDNWATEFDESSGTVTMRGRDITSVFIDTKVPMKKAAGLNLKQPIDKVVADLLETLPTDFDLLIDVDVDEAEWPSSGVPSPADKDGLTRVRRGADGEKPSAGTSSSKASYWDLITRWCMLVGATPYFDGRILKIRRTRNLWQTVLDPTVPTPFAGGKPRTIRKQNGNEEVRVRRLVHGRDLKSLAYERKYTGANVPLVEVVSLDDRQRGLGKLTIVQWPPEGSRAAQLKAPNERIRIVVDGVLDKDRLEAIAQDIYEEIGRGEMGGSAKTDEIASFGGDNSDPDILGIRPASTIELVVDTRALEEQNPLVSEYTDSTRRSFSDEIAAVSKILGGDENMARVIVATRRSAILDILRYYRVHSVIFSWDVKNGIKTAFDFQNYVVARHEAAVAIRPGEKRPKRRPVRKTGANNKEPKINPNEFAAGLVMNPATPTDPRQITEHYPVKARGNGHPVDFITYDLMQSMGWSEPEARKKAQETYNKIIQERAARDGVSFEEAERRDLVEFVQRR